MYFRRNVKHLSPSRIFGNVCSSRTIEFALSIVVTGVVHKFRYARDYRIYMTRVLGQICDGRDKGNFFETAFSLRASCGTPAISLLDLSPPRLDIKQTARNRSSLEASSFSYDTTSSVLRLLDEPVCVDQRVTNVCSYAM